MRSRLAVRGGVAVVVLALAAGVCPAEDLKGKFYVGGNLGVLVTTDNIRSNAALIIVPLGADGAPFTGDRGEEVACVSDPNAVASANVFCDPRPDDLIARQTQLEQTFKYDVVFGYGITSHLNAQLDVGYYEGDVTNFDVFTQKNVPFSSNPLDPCLAIAQTEPCDLRSVKRRSLRQPITAGTVKQIPVMANIVLRFRKDSNLNPYLGAGVGYLFASIDEDASVDALNDRMKKLNLISITDEFGPNFGSILSKDPNRGAMIFTDGNAPFDHPASVSLDGGFQWQAVGGLEYFFNDRLSLVFDAKYVLANHEIEISMKGEDQINLEAWTSDLFRSDGSLRVFKADGTAPNPIDPNSPTTGGRFDCDVNGDNVFDPPPRDYNNDADPNNPADPRRNDACYTPSPGIRDALKETIVVQGGKIRLTNFTFGFGLRFVF